MARITIPYAVADFVDLRERGYYYVDKTDFIPSLEGYNAPVFSVPGVSARVCLSLPWRVTMTAPRPIGSRSCSAGLGSVSTRRRNIIGIWSCAMISPRW
ncbi:Predicted AAA-ATPase [Parabacteroides distasonis]|nr:Predicted AAA-ATPase [Parabacteroides distasonis]